MNDKNTIRGEVIEVLPNTQFRVQVGDKLLLCYLGGRMKVHKVRVIIGDIVDIVYPQGSSIGRIVRRV